MNPGDHRISSIANEIILESISDGVFTVDHEWRITSFNRAAEEITGIPRAEAIGRYCWEVFRSNMCEGDCALKRTMKEGKSFVNSSTYIVNSEGRRIPISVSTSLLKNVDDRVLGGVETFRDISVVEELRRELSGCVQLGDMVSRSSTMRHIFGILEQVARSGSTVLIEGETGTGKEVLARAIHNLSPRHERPFVAINCGALPDTLLESELFGYKAGAFTGAERDKPGLFLAAEGGTLLLDEMGDTSPAFQVKLLRVLEEREFQPLGGVERLRSDVRVIAATNRDLSQLVGEGMFRRDLFYRINIIHLKLPPLRERREDIPLLIDRFVARMNRLRDRAVAGIDQEAMALLMEHSYPGNIRELENIIEHAFVLCGNETIGIRHLPAGIVLLPRGHVDRPVSAGEAVNLESAVSSTETRVILEALERNGYNRRATAKDLGMHTTTLFRRLRRLGLQLPERDGRSVRSPKN
ncbi:MAG: PAS domain S-box protein [Desulfobulbaceae bacterium]|nr:MAG: PAS domain S-box protein [Desulfobulbaceae bacterium]